VGRLHGTPGRRALTSGAGGAEVHFMNPVSAVTWLWRVWRSRSVTFAVLFATALLGISVLGGFRHALRELGAPWYVWLVLPLVAVSVCARKEVEWLPEAETRRKWSRWIVVGSIVLSLAIAKFSPKDPSTPPALPGGGRANPHGR
jgi:hypothetical protein